jgi:hypothetical protein
MDLVRRNETVRKNTIESSRVWEGVSTEVFFRSACLFNSRGFGMMMEQRGFDNDKARVSQLLSK